MASYPDIKAAVDSAACGACDAPIGTGCYGQPDHAVHVERVIAAERIKLLAALGAALAQGERYALTLARAAHGA